MRVLTVNAGSSSLKLRVVDDQDVVVSSADLSTPISDGAQDEEELRSVASGLSGIDAVGHRIVHGGGRLTKPQRIDDNLISQLTALTELAPLHQPASLRALNIITDVYPELPAVACFDTAFHATMPAAARTYALPQSWRQRWDLRRFGFHGLSHAYAARRAAQLLKRDPGRLVICHLGAGASLAAAIGRRCVDTTMGFTPLEGLVMATRSGSVDPGLILWLVDRAGIPASTVLDSLEHDSGLLGLAGTADMRSILGRARAGDETASLALGVYLHHLTAGIAAMAASLGGLDTLVFTGGVGERAWQIRTQAASRLNFLGVAIDEERNLHTQSDADITADADTEAALGSHRRGTHAQCLVITAREDLEIARDVRRVLRA